MTAPATISRRNLLFGRSAVAAQADRAVPYLAVVGDGCLARNKVDCQSCRDVCPEQVIGFRPRAGGPFLPEVDGDHCSGCGACIDICPVGAIALAERSGDAADA